MLGALLYIYKKSLFPIPFFPVPYTTKKSLKISPCPVPYHCQKTTKIFPFSLFPFPYPKFPRSLYHQKTPEIFPLSCSLAYHCQKPPNFPILPAPYPYPTTKNSQIFPFPSSLFHYQKIPQTFSPFPRLARAI